VQNTKVMLTGKTPPIKRREVATHDQKILKKEN
jgi:hypothetical protein